MSATIAVLIAIDLVLVVLVLTRHSRLHQPGETLLALGAMAVLPALVLWQGLGHHLEQSKTTAFCLSCHVMEPYGESLRIDSADHLPASHFQNRRIDRDQACYVCHTSYAMFGDAQAKLAGAQHLLVNYFGSMPDSIELYQPYENANCLHCHAGARAYEANDLHGSGDSCLECHELAHDLESLEALPRWSSGGASP